MQATILDKLFRPTRILDSFISFIWNDVYCGYGDFEIEYVMDENALAYVEEGYYVTCQESDRHMIIEKIEIKTSFEEGYICYISGRSLESILTRRILRQGITITGNLEDGILRMLNENVIAPENTKRRIDGFAMQYSSDPRITAMELNGEYETGDNLYDTIYSICNERHLGFKLTLHQERFFQFELYMGKDHSYSQSENPWVVFSPQFENLEESDMTIDLTNHKNCMEIDWTAEKQIVVTSGSAGTFSVETQKTVTPMTIGADVSGLERREVYGSSNMNVDEIDVSKFGTAANRVNKYKYMDWQVVGYDSDAYEKALKAWHDEYSSRLASVSTPAVKKITRTKTEAEGYNPDIVGTSAEWLNTIDEYVKEDPSVTAKRKAAAVAGMEDKRPNVEDYYTYGWVLVDPVGYENALNQAAKDIQAEVSAAVNAATDYAKMLVAQSGAESLSEYQEITSFDGKVDPNVNFIYRRDYDLGDIVQIVNAFRFNAVTRVASVMFSHDDVNGIIVRPTFESDDLAEVEFDLSDI